MDDKVSGHDAEPPVGELFDPGNTASSAAPVSSADPRPLSHRERRIIVTSMMVPVFLGSVDQSILATSLPTIGRGAWRHAQSAVADHLVS